MEGHSPVGWYGKTTRPNGVVRQAGRLARQGLCKPERRPVPRFFDFEDFFRLTVAFPAAVGDQPIRWLRALRPVEKPSRRSPACDQK